MLNIKQKSMFAMFVLVLGGMMASQGEEKSGKRADRMEKKDITMITATTSADGQSDVRTEVTKDCIMNLPNAETLEAQVTSETIHLQEVNGEAGHNEWQKVYKASLDVNYLVYQKELLIVTTRSVQGQEPVIKEVEKKLRKIEAFTSNPSEGDIYAGRSQRQYYYSKPETAIKDVKSRAKIWVQQQSSVLCPEK